MTKTDDVSITQRPNFFHLLGQTLVSPSETFHFIATHSSRLWIGCALLLILLTILPVVAQLQLTSEVVIPALTSDGRPTNPEVSPETDQIQQFNTMATLFAYVGVLLGTTFNWLLWAAFLLLLTSMLGGQAKFGQMWRLAIWSYLPLGISALLNALYGFTTGESPILNFSLANFVPNPFPEIDPTLPPEQLATVTFTPPDPAQMALFSAAGWFDIFVIWRLLLLIFGLAIIAKLSMRKSAMIVVGLWLLALVVSVGPSFFLGSFF